RRARHSRTAHDSRRPGLDVLPEVHAGTASGGDPGGDVLALRRYRVAVRVRVLLPGATMDHVDGKIWYAFLGAPLAWSLQLIIGYAMVAHACYPNMDPLNFAGAGGARITAQVGGDGVARYLSIAGVLTGIVFTLLIVFNLIALIVEPTCRFA